MVSTQEETESTDIVPVWIGNVKTLCDAKIGDILYFPNYRKFCKVKKNKKLGASFIIETNYGELVATGHESMPIGSKENNRSFILYRRSEFNDTDYFADLYDYSK